MLFLFHHFLNLTSFSHPAYSCNRSYVWVCNVFFLCNVFMCMCVCVCGN